MSLNQMAGAEIFTPQAPHKQALNVEPSGYTNAYNLVFHHLKQKIHINLDVNLDPVHSNQQYNIVIVVQHKEIEHHTHKRFDQHNQIIIIITLMLD